jgi:hypothetical protein
VLSAERKNYQFVQAAILKGIAQKNVKNYIGKDIKKYVDYLDN